MDSEGEDPMANFAACPDDEVLRQDLGIADELVIGSYAPQTEPHSFEFPRYDWLEAPKGMMYRGAYTASDRFVDGDGRTHLEYDYPVKVTK